MAPQRRLTKGEYPNHTYSTRFKSKRALEYEHPYTTRSKRVKVEELPLCDVKLPPWKCPKGYGYKKLENGLLDMTWIPQPLEKITKRNNKISPLLRLPAEIRNMICEYALSGNIIQLGSKGQKAQIRPRYAAKACFVWLKRTQLFALPRTCRQLYAETATIAYRCNIFCADGVSDQKSGWSMFISTCVPAQIEAITSVCPSFRHLREVMPRIQTLHQLETHEVHDGFWTQMHPCRHFPNLKQVVVRDSQVFSSIVDYLEKRGMEVLVLHQYGEQVWTEYTKEELKWVDGRPMIPRDP